MNEFLKVLLNIRSLRATCRELSLEQLEEALEKLSAIVAERHYAPDPVYRRFVYLHDLGMRNRTNHRRRSH